MAHIKSVDLAQRFRHACLPIIRKRYGQDSDLKVEKVEEDFKPQILKRIDRDSEVIEERLRTNNLSPNKSPRIGT